MVALWVLGLLDVFSAAGMVFLHFGWIDGRLAASGATYLIGKGLAFRDFASIMDAVIGVYIVGMWILGWHTFLVYVFLVLILQKAILGFVTS